MSTNWYTQPPKSDRKRKYTLVIPVMMSALLIAGLMAIITNGLSFSVNTTYNSQTGMIAPGSYSTVGAITWSSDIASPEMQLTLAQIYPFNPAQYTNGNNMTVEVLVFSSRPSFTYNGNFSQLTNSTDMKYLIDQYTASTTVGLRNINVDGYTSIFLVFHNLESTQTSINLSVTATIDSSNATIQTGLILRTVFSAIFTFICLILTILMWFDFAVMPKDKPWKRDFFIKDQHEEFLEGFVTKASSIQLLAALGALILFPISISFLLSGVSSPDMFFTIALFLIVYITFNDTQTAIRNINRVVEQQGTETLERLAKAIGKNTDSTKKLILHMITSGNYPLEYNFDRDLVTYRGNEPQESSPSTQQSAQHGITDSQQVIVPAEEEVHEVGQTVCPYCGEIALVKDAKFCAECGASILPSK